MCHKSNEIVYIYIYETYNLAYSGVITLNSDDWPVAITRMKEMVYCEMKIRIKLENYVLIPH